MAEPLKFIAYFRFDEGYGWSETHYRLSTGQTPDLRAQISNFNSQIMGPRVSLLGAQSTLIGTRVSYRRPGAVASFPSVIVMDGDQSKDTEDEETSLALLWVDSTDSRRKVTHLRGFWDSVIQGGFYNPDAPGAEGWTDRLGAFKSALVSNGYGWLSVDPALSRKGIVTNYTTGVDGRVTFTLGAPGMTGLTNGETYAVRFSRLNDSKSVLNRLLLVEKITDTSLRTAYPVAAGPFQGQGRYNFRGTTFVPYKDVTTVTVGSRRMGKVLRARAGRSAARPKV